MYVCYAGLFILFVEALVGMEVPCVTVGYLCVCEPSWEAVTLRLLFLAVRLPFPEALEELALIRLRLMPTTWVVDPNNLMLDLLTVGVVLRGFKVLALLSFGECII